MNFRKLKVNLAAARAAEEDDGLNHDSVRLGTLLVSSKGLTTSSSSSRNNSAYGLTVKDLVVTPEGPGQLLGKGSSGSVWRAVNRRTGGFVALKEVQVSSTARQNEIRRELETLYNVESSASTYMVDFYGAFYHEGAVFIAMECLDGSLDRLPQPIPSIVLASIVRSVLHGLSYLHRQRYLIHRDIKPSNLLYSRATGEVKVSDFGISSHLDGTSDNAHTFVGTLTYMSPERLKGEHYSYAADVWSLGLVVAQLALGCTPFHHLQGVTTEMRFWAILQHVNSDAPVVDLPDTVEANLANFIHACLRKDPQTRPTCEELLEHPFLLSVQPEREDRERIRCWLEKVYSSPSSSSSSSQASSSPSSSSSSSRDSVTPLTPKDGSAVEGVPSSAAVDKNDQRGSSPHHPHHHHHFMDSPSPLSSPPSPPEVTPPPAQVVGHHHSLLHPPPLLSSSPEEPFPAGEPRHAGDEGDNVMETTTGSPASAVSNLSLDEELQRLVGVQRVRPAKKK